jgi:hypothetical protein
MPYWQVLNLRLQIRHQHRPLAGGVRRPAEQVRPLVFDDPFSASEISGLGFSPIRRKEPAGRRRSQRKGIVPAMAYLEY